MRKCIRTFSLVLILIVNVIVIHACSPQKPQCDSYSQGDSSNYAYMTPSEFPALQFGPSDFNHRVIDEKISKAQHVQELLELADLIAPIDIAWPIVKKAFDQMETINEFQLQKMKQTVDDTVTSAHIHLTNADIKVLETSTQRMLDKNLPRELRKLEVVPARNLCIKIVNLFGNREYVFWKDTVHSSGYLLSFTPILTTVGALAIELDSTSKEIFTREYKTFKTILNDYKVKVKPLRSQELIQRNFYTDGFNNERNRDYLKGKLALCDHLYYYKCPDFAKRLRATPTKKETHCAKAIWDKDLVWHYKSEARHCASHGSGRGQTWCNAYVYYNHPKYSVPGKPAIKSTLVFDPISNNYACGDWDLCLKDYKNEVEHQVENAFNKAIKLVQSQIK